MAEVILVEYQVKGLDGLTTELTQASTATEQLNQDLDKTAKATTSAKAQLRQMNNELATMIANGDTSSQKFKELTNRAGQLSDAIQDASGYIKTAGSDTSGLDKALRATNVLVGGFAAVQGATALFGKESENLQKTLLKVNAAMSILAGLQQIQEELSKQDSIFTAAAARAKTLYAAAVGSATGAMKAFRLAVLGIIGLGIAAVVTAIAVAWNKLSKATAEAAKLQKQVAEAAQSETSSLNQLLATARDETLSRERRNQAVKEINKLFPEYLASLTLENIKTKETNKSIEQQIALILLREKAQILAKKAAEEQIKLDEVIAKGPTLLQNLISGSLGYERAVDKQRAAVAKATAAYEAARTELDKLPTATEQVTVATEKTTKAVNDLKKAIDPKRLNQWERAFQSIKTVLGQGGESLAGRLDRLREAAAALNKEATGGGGRAGATGVDPVVDTYAKRSAAAEQYLALATAVNSQINNIVQQSQAAQLAQLEEQRAQGLITEKQYIQQVQALRKKQAEQDKKLAIFNIILNTAQAVSKALATAAFPFNVVLAALAASLGAAELAIAKRTPIPAFRKGVIDLQGPGTATSDSITARLSKGESVMTAEETKNHRDVLLSIRKKQFDRMYMPVNEVLKKNKPMSIPAAQLKGHIDINGGMAVKLDKIYEELVYNNLYTREGNRHTFKIRQAVTKVRHSNGIRV